MGEISQKKKFFLYLPLNGKGNIWMKIPVPQSHHFVSVHSDRNAKCSELKGIEHQISIEVLTHIDNKYLAKPKSAILIAPFLSIKRF